MEENIADALKMAGSVLLFVMGLSIAILAFSQARESMDIVLSYSDRESLSIEGNPRFYYLSKDNDTSRYVGKETIIPAIYRAYKENYKIVFKFPDDYYLFKQEVKNAKGLNKEKKISTLDLANQSLSSDLASRQFLNGIIYGDFEYENEKSYFPAGDRTARQRILFPFLRDYTPLFHPSLPRLLHTEYRHIENTGRTGSGTGKRRHAPCQSGRCHLCPQDRLRALRHLRRR